MIDTPDAIAERIARCPEWKKVLSPMFWKMWSSSTKRDIPTHCAPSPPICVMPMLRPTRSSGM